MGESFTGLFDRIGRPSPMKAAQIKSLTHIQSTLKTSLLAFRLTALGWNEEGEGVFNWILTIHVVGDIGGQG